MEKSTIKPTAPAQSTNTNTNGMGGSKIRLWLALDKVVSGVIFQCGLQIQETANSPWITTEKTECLEYEQGHLSIIFQKPLEINFQFAKEQKLKFKIMNKNPDGSKTHHGEVVTTLGAIFGTTQNCIMYPITSDAKYKGNLTIRLEYQPDENWEVQFNLSLSNCQGLVYGGCCVQPKSADALSFEIHKLSTINPALEYIKAFESEKGNWGDSGYKFGHTKVKANKLCNGIKWLPLQIKIMQHDSTYPHPWCIVVQTFSIHSLVFLRQREIWVNYWGRPMLLKFEDPKIIQKPPMGDYIKDGWSLNLSVAIDFTSTNGDATQPTSNHYIGGANQYDQAIHAVGSILEPYDSDNLIPVYGFGGVPPGSQQVSHCFPLNGNPQNPEVKGLAEIQKVYKEAVMKTALAGPRNLSPLLTELTNKMKANPDKKSYHILLILTNGDVEDNNATRDLIVATSDLPYSVIIVGIGKEKFKSMKILDADKTVLRDSKGNLSKRDLVQFVKFQKVVVKGNHELAEEVLEEIPEQFVNYMLLKGIKATPPPAK